MSEFRSLGVLGATCETGLVIDVWAAPRARGPLSAVVELPGSKSVTNRVLVLAALADGRSVVRRPLRSRDTELMSAGLQALGVPVSEDGADWVVDGTGDALHPTTDRIDVGNAGTVARFLPPAAGAVLQEGIDVLAIGIALSRDPAVSSSTSIVLSLPRSSTMPPSLVERPLMPCPRLRTDSAAAGRTMVDASLIGCVFTL